VFSCFPGLYGPGGLLLSGGHVVVAREPCGVDFCLGGSVFAGDAGPERGPLEVRIDGGRVRIRCSSVDLLGVGGDLRECVGLDLARYLTDRGHDRRV
jgi:hypothetical protein